MFPENLRSLMDMQRLSAKRVASEAGVTERIVHLWLRGNRNPTAKSLAKLADVFGLSMDEMWKGEVA